MLGPDGMTQASKIAILNANYLASRLSEHYPVLYKGNKGLVAHECILDMRALKAATDVTVDDIAKRLMDHGYHAPTISWPVVGTKMNEKGAGAAAGKAKVGDIFQTAQDTSVQALKDAGLPVNG